VVAASSLSGCRTFTHAPAALDVDDVDPSGPLGSWWSVPPGDEPADAAPDAAPSLPPSLATAVVVVEVVLPSSPLLAPDAPAAAAPVSFLLVPGTLQAWVHVELRHHASLCQILSRHVCTLLSDEPKVSLRAA
jgi:hypothetical protein